MLKKTSFLPFILLLTIQNAEAQFKKVLDKAQKTVETISKNNDLSNEEIGSGLKEALDVGVSEAADYLSAKDGFFLSPYKILVPEEAQKVVAKLKVVPGFNNLEADLIERMNRAAEDAAIRAKPIFIAAIKGISFEDAFKILTGNQDAATRFLERSTYANLYAEFKPVIQISLDKVNAREYWKSAVTAYNKIPFVTKTNPELDDHVTRMALLGMFSLVEKKEKEIRTNINQRKSDLLKRVFAKQDR
jgi:hypothetical protein